LNRLKSSLVEILFRLALRLRFGLGFLWHGQSVAPLAIHRKSQKFKTVQLPKIGFSASQAPYIRKRTWHPSQKIETEPGGSDRLHSNAG
jgi:hypothetical protein